MIRTTSKRPRGHSNAGVFHHPEAAGGSRFDDGFFSEAQLTQLEDDPDLTVVRTKVKSTGQPPARALSGAEAGGTALAELAAERERLTALESNLAERKTALDAADAAMTERQRIIEELLANETFRAIALRYGIKRVVEGKAEADFMKNGAPKTEAISREALGIECSAKERDALVAELYPPK